MCKFSSLLTKLLTGTSFLVIATAIEAAGVNFNFQPEGTFFTGGANPTGSIVAGNDGSRFYQNTIDINGVKYFHVVVGDPNTGFAIESYVTAATINTGSNSRNPTAPRGSSPDSGGNERALIGDQTTLGTDQNAMLLHRLIGNAKDTFGITVNPASGFKYYDLSGNGTANPNRAMLRMVMTDTDPLNAASSVSVEVFKPLLENKPVISQVTSDTEMVGEFVADMRGLTYSDMTKAAPVLNRLSLTVADMPSQGAGDFDMSMVQQSNVTAGQYIYTPGTGWSAPTDPTGLSGWDVDGSTFGEGTYTYSDGPGFNLEADWSKFFDYTTNASYCQTGFRRLSRICR